MGVTPLERPLPRRKGVRTPSPAKVIALSFFSAILVGAFLLWVPWSHAPGTTVTPLDALFTATSAICVTGLTVVDTETAWSSFGRVIIMLLIQVGGLGIVTLGTLVALLLGRRVGFRERLQAAAQVNTLETGGVLRLIRTIFLISLGFETVGAMLLYPTFAALHGPGQGLFYAFFHSVSAFNNAGFALYSDNLVGFAGNPVVILVLSALFIIGGLGFIVHLNLWAHVRGGRRFPLTLHSRVVLLTTLLLCAVGTLAVLVLEWSNPQTLGALPWHGKLLNGFFQGVTPRTAGFNSVDYTLMREPTLLLSMLLMFIGGSPASTAGGVKTVTFFVLVASAWSMVRGRGELLAFGRRVSSATVVKAGSVALLSTGLVMSALFLLSVSESLPLLPVMFEAFSAFATVGLSMSATFDLSEPGRLIIIVLMYLGRIGPLTFALALLQEPRGGGLKYPDEGVLIG
ncbi:MAG: KtrAB potassium uptake system, integral membrane component KtrB [uncultured Truepera sp.]|uniref:KtrAB potassium uptake system, integral membrane component KtrB n=1 Tax=uncultured Truepera sp. TaxID=543023 RepID=A0A6J4UVJ7_9DEIN|nr:MAG: KtrAB potassium uptake system, integral membrane component KtrB [uncultured Truepera sp.]